MRRMTEQDKHPTDAQETREDTAYSESVSEPTSGVSDSGNGVEATHTDPVEESLSPADYMEMLMQAVDQQLKPPEPGQIIQGRVIHIGSEFAVIDIGYRVEGLLPLDEVRGEDGQLLIQEGDTVDVLVQRYGPDQEYIPVSKRQAEFQKAWTRIVRAYEQGETLRGRIVRVLKGGYFVDLGGARAFLPGSQVDIRRPDDYESWLGQEVDVRVINLDPQRHSVIVSRRVILEEERERRRQELLAIMRPGLVLEGTVKNITDYGVFVDLGGLDGMIHKSDLSWHRVAHPSEVVEIGQRIRVKVLAFDPETQRVSLGLKQLQPDPWTRAVRKYRVGDTVHGVVTNVVDYGAFVEIEPGVSGLVHITELSWSPKIRHPSQVVQPGDSVEVRIIDIDTRRKRISLSLKAVQPNPVERFLAEHPPGSVVEARVDRFNMKGAIVVFADYPEITGFIPLPEITWERKPQPPSEYLHKGDIVRAEVLRASPRLLRVYLSIRRLQPNPWQAFAAQYPEGSVVRGTIAEKFERGCFVRLEDHPELEALLPRGHYLRKRVRRKWVLVEPEPGETYEFKVIQIEPQRRRIVLSLRELQIERIRQELEEARRKREQEKEAAKVRLGDLVAKQLEKLKQIAQNAGEESNS